MAVSHDSRSKRASKSSSLFFFTMADAENLNYDCNYNMFLVKMMISNLEKPDQKLVLKWIRKLSGCSRTLTEMRERNEYMYNLVLNVQCGVLEYPFSAPPPAGPLRHASEFWDVPGRSKTDVRSVGGAATPEADASEPLPKSPEGEEAGAHSEEESEEELSEENSGSFIVPDPPPRCGAYFYLEIYPKK